MSQEIRELSDYLTAQYREPVPDWLAAEDAGSGDVRQLLRSFLASRLVFYPGSSLDGDPVAVFNRAHAAHCFLYVDYQTPREELEAALDEGFRGYRTLARIELSLSDLVSRRVPQPNSADDRPPFEPVPPYGILALFQREDGLTDDHGAARFALMFLAADAYDVFGALFCQKDRAPAPFCAVIQDHGFGGGYGSFGRGGSLEQMAHLAGIRPRFLLAAANTPAWDGFAPCGAAPVPIGMHRTLHALYA